MKKAPTPKEHIEVIIDLALAEDLGHGDVTSETLVPPELEGKATITAKEPGTVAGIPRGSIEEGVPQKGRCPRRR